MSKRNLRRIFLGSRCADILRNIRNKRNMMSATITYHHMDGHMDKYLLWKQLLLEQKMNVMCNNPVKCAVSRAIRPGMRREKKQLLHSEDAAVFVNNRNLTSNLAKVVRYGVDKEKACKYLTSQGCWTDKQFDKVDWDRLHMALMGKARRLQGLAHESTHRKLWD